MQKFTVEGIKDYQTCARLYDYRHLEARSEAIVGRELLAQRFENTLKSVASFFHYKKQAGISPSYNALLNRWEKLWFPRDMTAYDLAVEQHEVSHGNLASYSNAAALSLMQFHEDFTEDQGTPIMLDEAYSVPLGREMRLEGTIDLVLREKNTYKVVKWCGRQKRPNNAMMRMDFAALRLAFDYRNNGHQPARFFLYDLASIRPGWDEIEVTDDDVRALLYWMQDAHTSGVLPPRRGLTAYCRGCPFDQPCASWNEWPGSENE